MLRKLEFLYRWIGTGIAFFAFFHGGLFLSLIVFPAIRLITSNSMKRQHRVQWIIHFTFKLYITSITKLRLISLTHTEIENLKRCRGKIIIANHPSLLDVVIVMSYVPNAYCMVKHKLWDNKYLGGVVRSAGYIPNNLDADKMLDTCKAITDRGDNLIIFPEGTRTTPGTDIKFQRSFAQLAIMTKATLMPVVIKCEVPFLTKCRPWYRLTSERAHFHVSVEKTIETTDYDNKPRSIAAREITRSLQKQYEEKLEYAAA